jgi:hypothetical protein
MQLEGSTSTGGGYLEVVLVEYDSALDDYSAHLLYLDYLVSDRRRSRSGVRWREIDGGVWSHHVGESFVGGHFGKVREYSTGVGYGHFGRIVRIPSSSRSQITCCIPGPLIWVNGDHYRIDELL